MSTPPTGQRAIKPLRILLVEDHDDTVRMMRLLLERDGHTVDVARTLEQASAKCARGGFDLMISDIELPDGFAFDLIEDGKACHGIKAIVVSGHGMVDHIERSRRAGFLAHMVKPFRMDELRRVVAQTAAQ